MAKLATDEPLARNIHQLMNKQGWNVRSLCREAGINHFTLHNLFRGLSKKPSADKLEALARVLGTSTHALLYGENLTADRPKFIANPQEWDGLLYADCVIMARDVYLEKHPTATFVDHSLRRKLAEVARKIYVYTLKKGHSQPDREFTELLLEE